MTEVFAAANDFYRRVRDAAHYRCALMHTFLFVGRGHAPAGEQPLSTNLFICTVCRCAIVAPYGKGAFDRS